MDRMDAFIENLIYYKKKCISRQRTLKCCEDCKYDLGCKTMMEIRSIFDVDPHLIDINKFKKLLYANFKIPHSSCVPKN